MLNQAGTKKLLQKQAYDCLSNKYALLCVFLGCVVILVSAFNFGEAWLEWSKDKYLAVFNSYTDNLIGKSFQTRLCQHVPIDMVYTWVNGSDPDLLANLRTYKESLQNELNVSNANSNSSKCPYDSCVLADTVVVRPVVPEAFKSIFLENLGLKRSDSSKMRVVRERFADDHSNVTLLTLSNPDVVHQLLEKKQFLHLGFVNYSLTKAHWSSEVNVPYSVFANDTLILSGVHSGLDSVGLLNKLPKFFPPFIEQALMYPDRSLAVLKLRSLDGLNKIMKMSSNLTVDGREIRLHQAHLVLRVIGLLPNERELSPSRFQDNEELRYSLRSVERYAPWIRRVYLVTNGQIPHWLNLDNPRIVLVTHDEIFVNRSHLPTFSSPAIEANIHRIPDLSDKFLYMNDDVMFGAPVWPDDFYSSVQGQKVYLSWPVPECSSGCPSSWIKDGYCDKACNNSLCMWDGGDCDGEGANQGGGYMDWESLNAEDANACAPSCSNSWLADRYCDRSCNNVACGFDAGDCGISHFDQLHKEEYMKGKQSYSLPNGTVISYWNISKIVDKVSISEGTYEEHAGVRTMAVSVKYKVLVLLLYPNHVNITTSISLKGSGANGTVIISFNVTANTKEPVLPKDATNRTEAIPEEPPVEFEKFEEVGLRPKVLGGSLDDSQPYSRVNLTASELPAQLVQQINDLHQQYLHFEITKHGFFKKKSKAIEDHLRWCEENSAPLPKLVYESSGDSQANKEGTVKEVNVIEESKANVERNEPPAAVQNKMPLQPAKQAAPPVAKEGKPLKERVEKDEPQSVFDGDAFLKGNQMEKPAEEDNPKLEENQAVEVGGDFGEPQEQQGQGPKLPEEAEAPQVQQVRGPAEIVEAVESMVGQQPMEESAARYLNKRSSDDDGKVQGPQIRKILGFDEPSKEKRARYFDQRGTFEDFSGNLPWEKQRTFDDLMAKKEAHDTYHQEPRSGRRLLDTYGDSLRHVNNLYNLAYGFEARRVPAHMPHLLDKHILYELHEKFPDEWGETSSHKIRSSTDMQFAFSYFYFLMSEKGTFDAERLFLEVDTDLSGTWSDREIRTLLARIYELPLSLNQVTEFEDLIINCSNHLPSSYSKGIKTPMFERYLDSRLPVVSRELVLNCRGVMKVLQDKFANRKKYDYVVGGEGDVTFKMLHSNLSVAVGQLDDVRRHPSKFICLNDNLDHRSGPDTGIVKALLVDFYESMFPIQSSFELPMEYRNRFLHVYQLRRWRFYRDLIRFCTYTCLGLLILFSLCSFFQQELKSLELRFLGGRRWRRRKETGARTAETV